MSVLVTIQIVTILLAIFAAVMPVGLVSWGSLCLIGLGALATIVLVQKQAKRESEICDYVANTAGKRVGTGFECVRNALKHLQETGAEAKRMVEAELFRERETVNSLKGELEEAQKRRGSLPPSWTRAIPCSTRPTRSVTSFPAISAI